MLRDKYTWILLGRMFAGPGFRAGVKIAVARKVGSCQPANYSHKLRGSGMRSEAIPHCKQIGKQSFLGFCIRYNLVSDPVKGPPCLERASREILNHRE
jgi:hypothetical protein